MGLFKDAFTDPSKATREDIDRLIRERDEARTLASRLHVDLDRLATESDGFRSRLYGAERVATTCREETKLAKLALLQSNQQGAAVRNELVRVQQVAPLRYRAILALRWEAQLAAEKANAVMDLQCSLAETKAGLIRAEQRIEQLKNDRENEPISDMELLMAYKRLRGVFESLQSTLTCSLCYEPFDRNAVMSFQCGHTFCAACVSQWAVVSAVNRLHATEGKIMTPECPECRGDASRTGRLRVFMLEEAVRNMQRLNREDLSMLPEEAPAEMQLDAEAAAILMPRERSRYYGGH